MRYRIVEGVDPAAMAGEVGRLLDKGWIPHGGMTMVATGAMLRYAQAMTLDKPARDGVSEIGEMVKEYNKIIRNAAWGVHTEAPAKSHPVRGKARKGRRRTKGG